MKRQIFKHILLFLITVISLDTFSQEIPVGSWRDHLRYTDAVSVTYGNNIVYCASSSALFTYNLADNSIQRLNLVNGLSDIGLSNLEYNNIAEKLVITYSNGNIDLMTKENIIINIPFVKNSNIIGDKSINNIYIKDNLAYLSTGFGIVVLDCLKNEIIDTYYIGINGEYIGVNAIAFDANNIYAASEEGVYFASKTSGNLADYNEWNIVPELGPKNYNQITFFSNRLFVSYDDPLWASDTIYYNDAGTWSKFLPNGLNITQLSVFENKLIVIENSSASSYDLDLNLVQQVYTYKGQFSLSPFDVIIKDNVFWIADNDRGLIKLTDNWNGEIIAPSGPNSSFSFLMDFVDGKLGMVSGAYGTFLYDTPNFWENNFWDETVPKSIYDKDNKKVRDFVAIAIDPSNKNHVYYGAWDQGLFEFNGNTKVDQFLAQNTPLDSTFFGTTRVSSLVFDSEQNLWALSSYSDSPLSVRTPNGDWYNYSFQGILTKDSYYTKTLVDANGWKWIADLRENGILVFDDNKTLQELSDDRFVYINSSNTNNANIFDANLPGARIYSMEIDLDGEIWIGSDEGVAVINNPNDVFSQNITASQIFVQEDGQTQILLESELVTSIAIDGANRKWFGTQSSGVFLMSEDGTEQISHFTTDNSPLFSNNIFDIKINGKTGEVFIATEKGLISYKGTATESNEDFDNVFVYPNPVKPDYTGVIAIRGLTKDTDVRITDISGNIVSQTISYGGQAIWDGNDLNGNRVQTGVYLVFNATKDGELKKAAKILFVN
ncbi:T9SS type A sorting domain-containing protein [Vicingus serpentipes]|uniref:T9SS type A sorting domain-containing protein n=1 Tax=Vicingus serpentipes TaxID=1926625 RepID=A0A5C6RST1_9FLAO|nr:T9SS type A sorting domain-containing protein [Vicingus serpentipes]TXB64700.1 T9SS type A sorting domain-containing protein [Vicingus serpentipes]